MAGRFSPLTSLALLLGLATFLTAAGPARAHGLDAQAFLLPDRKVQIESWFSNGDIPHQAQVQIYRPSGELLTEGTLDDKGLFVFSFSQPEALRVIVSAGGGHRKELEIPQSRLEPAPSAEPQVATSPSSPAVIPSAPVPLTDRRSQESIKNVLVGIGFILALAAFVISLGNARRLRILDKETGKQRDKETRRQGDREIE